MQVFQEVSSSPPRPTPLHPRHASHAAHTRTQRPRAMRARCVRDACAMRVSVAAAATPRFHRNSASETKSDTRGRQRVDCRVAVRIGCGECELTAVATLPALFHRGRRRGRRRRPGGVSSLYAPVAGGQLTTPPPCSASCYRGRWRCCAGGRHRRVGGSGTPSTDRAATTRATGAVRRAGTPAREVTWWTTDTRWRRSSFRWCRTISRSSRTWPSTCRRNRGGSGCERRARRRRRTFGTYPARATRPPGDGQRQTRPARR